MMLKSLELENIRSYDKLKLDFPQGTILFEGPSGSGKSTVLMAIEFALFGLGSLKGGSLLRLGQKQGSVTLTFEINGQNYTVHRTLERMPKSVHQGSGYIIEPSGKLSLEASELKQRILEILHFNEPEDPKAQSWIYRYAVFTPQEEMKAILSYKPDMRLQTLRKAFRLEEYKTAQDNAGKLDLKIEHKITQFDTEAKGLEDKKRTLGESDAEKTEKTKKIAELEKEETQFQSDIDGLRKDLGKLQDDKIKLNKLQAEMPQIQKQIDDKTFDIKTLADASDKARTKLAELQRQMEPLEKEKRPFTHTTEQLEKKIEDFQGQEKRLGKAENKINDKLEDYEKIEKDKKCPTCDRPADVKNFHALVKKKRDELRKAGKALKDCEEELKAARALLKGLQRFEANQETLSHLRERAGEFKLTLDTNAPKITKLNEKRDGLSKELEGKKKEAEGLKDVQVKINELDKSITEKEKSLKDTRNNLSSFRQRMADLVNAIDDLTKAIKKMEDAKKTAGRLKDFHVWLNGYFVNTLTLIERQVLIAINQGFNGQFQKWFNLLVEDPTKYVDIDEDFTPTITQDGYDQDVDFLSGGEKTSAALAYRLALNNIVQQVSIGMKSNLLILDEPTDGFSKEQLYKIRDILHELHCPQVVLVSHETELESFADQIIRVNKANGESRIQPGAGL